MIKYLSLFLLFVFIFSCRPAKLNQYFTNPDKSQVRNGLWTENASTDEGTVVETGRYNKGIKKGTWKTSLNRRLIQTEKFRGSRSKIKVFGHNGKLLQKGQTRTEKNGSEVHWYYFGDWKFYDENGRLLYIKNYEKGTKTDSISKIKARH